MCCFLLLHASAKNELIAYNVVFKLVFEMRARSSITLSRAPKSLLSPQLNLEFYRYKLDTLRKVCFRKLFSIGSALKPFLPALLRSPRLERAAKIWLTVKSCKLIGGDKGLKALLRVIASVMNSSYDTVSRCKYSEHRVEGAFIIALIR